MPAGGKGARAIKPYLTACIASASTASSCQHLQAFVLDDHWFFVAVEATMIRLFSLWEEKTADETVDVEEIDVARAAIPARFIVQTARFVHLDEQRPVLVLGSRQGEIALWDPRWAMANRQGTLRPVDVDAESVTAVTPLRGPGGQPLAGTAIVAVNREAGAALLRIGISPELEVTVEAEFPTPLYQIRTMDLGGKPKTPLVLAGEGTDLVGLRAELLGAGEEMEEQGRRPLDSAVTSVKVTPTADDREFLMTTCTRDGRIFALDISPKKAAWSRIRWVFQLFGGGKEIYGDPGCRELAVLFGRGQLVLLDPDGKRTFGYSPPEMVEAAALVPGDDAGGDLGYLVTAGASGRMTVLKKTGGVRMQLPEAERILEHFDGDTEGIETEAGESGWLLDRLRNGASGRSRCCVRPCSPPRIAGTGSGVWSPSWGRMRWRGRWWTPANPSPTGTAPMTGMSCIFSE